MTWSTIPKYWWQTPHSRWDRHQVTFMTLAYHQLSTIWTGTPNARPTLCTITRRDYNDGYDHEKSLTSLIWKISISSNLSFKEIFLDNPTAIISNMGLVWLQQTTQHHEAFELGLYICIYTYVYLLIYYSCTWHDTADEMTYLQNRWLVVSSRHQGTLYCLDQL